MAEYSANAIQIVNPGESIIFTETDVPCRRGFIRHREGSGNFLLSGQVGGCGCFRTRSAMYLIDCGCNISIPTGGTVEPISIAIAIDGDTIPTSTMTITPAAVDEYTNVSRAINVPIWAGCCETVSVRNISTQPIQVQNANIIFARPDLAISR